MDTGIHFLLPGFILDFAALYMNHVERIHRYLAELSASTGNPVTDGEIVYNISHGQQRRQHEQPESHYAFYSFNHLGAVFTLMVGALLGLAMPFRGNLWHCAIHLRH
jgi:hypothetical protein